MEPKTGYDALKLENQLCFPLYAASKEVVRRYRPFLAPLGITYTQYIVLMVLWEYRSTTVKDLGQRLYLDSGTLTPLLKKLEANGYVVRTRSDADERSVTIMLTADGEALREQAKDVPLKMARCVNLEPDEAATLMQLLRKVLRAAGDGDPV